MHDRAFRGNDSLLTTLDLPSRRKFAIALTLIKAGKILHKISA